MTSAPASTSALSPPPLPSAPAAAAMESDFDLLQLLEEFTADDIDDVVRAVDADTSQPELLLSPSSSTTAATAPSSSPFAQSFAVPGAATMQSLELLQRDHAAPPHPSRQLQLRSPQNTSKRAAAGARPKPVRRNDPNRARNGRREELIYLHKKVAELEVQLHKIKTNAPSSSGAARRMVAIAAARTSAGASSQFDATSMALASYHPVRSGAQGLLADNDESAAAAARIWKDLADRQRELRVQSERENIRLKLVLETQLKIAKSLEKILLKPASTRSIPDRSDAAIFDELLAGVEQSYAEIDAVFEANGLSRLETTHKDARMRRDAHGNVYMEIFANKVLPFGIHETGDAVWHHFVFGKETIPNRYHTENAPKVFLPTISSYLKNFGLEVRANHKSANFRVKQVLRQHVEADERVVIVWQALIDPIAFSGDPLLLPGDVGFIEKGYIVMKRPETLQGNLTLLRTCHIITPNLRNTNASAAVSEATSAEDSFARVGALTDFVLSATAANISTSYQIIENVLLEQSLKMKSGSSDTSEQ